METITSLEAYFQAIESGDLERVQACIEAHPAWVNQENNVGLTPLGYAAHYGHADIVTILLAAGAEVNAISHSVLSFIPSNTALHAALAGAKKEAVIELLLAHGASVQLFDSSGHTPLHVAAFHDGNVGSIRTLIEHGADVNASQGSGDTPLDIAISQGNEAVSELLKQHGARRNHH